METIAVFEILILNCEVFFAFLIRSELSTVLYFI